jgi:hypothetical protein
LMRAKTVRKVSDPKATISVMPGSSEKAAPKALSQTSASNGKPRALAAEAAWELAGGAHIADQPRGREEGGVDRRGSWRARTLAAPPRHAECTLAYECEATTKSTSSSSTRRG